MAINYPNFRQLTAADMGGFDLANAIKNGLNNYNLYQEAKFKPKNLQEALLKAHQENMIKAPYAQNADRSFEADIGGQEARTGLTRAQTESIPSEIENRQANTYKQQLLNKFLPQREQAEIGEIGSRSKYYEQGGSSANSGTKNYNAFVNGVAADNPNLSPEQIREATDVLAKGGVELKDGTKLNPMSFGTNVALDRAIRDTTTAAQINAGLNANQAESEIDILKKYADKGIAPYGNTFANQSSQQIVDTFKSDPESQKQLGRFIGAQGLNYEITQNRIKLANGQPGVTSTEHLMELSKQNINAKYPRLSAIARKEASDYMDEALKAGLHARNKIGVSPSYLTKMKYAQEEANSSKNSDAFLKQISSQLMVSMPDATPENIKHTAQETGQTVEQVIEQLIKSQGGR